MRVHVLDLRGMLELISYRCTSQRISLQAIGDSAVARGTKPFVLPRCFRDPLEAAQCDLQGIGLPLWRGRPDCEQTRK
jgi:hypothetical protein